jgi:hypothetical protein
MQFPPASCCPFLWPIHSPQKTTLSATGLRTWSFTLREERRITTRNNISFLRSEHPSPSLLFTLLGSTWHPCKILALTTTDRCRPKSNFFDMFLCQLRINNSEHDQQIPCPLYNPYVKCSVSRGPQDNKYQIWLRLVKWHIWMDRQDRQRPSYKFNL